MSRQHHKSTTLSRLRTFHGSTRDSMKLILRYRFEMASVPDLNVL